MNFFSRNFSFFRSNLLLCFLSFFPFYSFHLFSSSHLFFYSFLSFINFSFCFHNFFFYFVRNNILKNFFCLFFCRQIKISKKFVSQSYFICSSISYPCY